MMPNALVSVHDKSYLIHLLPLAEVGWKFYASGGTYAALEGVGIACNSVEALTGYPQILDDRVKTLHPGVHAGILADPKKERHTHQMSKYRHIFFSLVVVNLYPFQENPRTETIDIGGPAMIRGAAKNSDNVLVVIDPSLYQEVVRAIIECRVTADLRDELSLRVFEYTSAYDAAIARWKREQITIRCESRRDLAF